MFKRVWPAMTLLIFSLPAWAQSAAEPPAPAEAATATDVAQQAEAPPQVVLVSGSRPGPGLWKVSKGENVMWVFGTYSPLPAKMEWRSRDVEKVIASSQEYLKPPGYGIGVGMSSVFALPFLVGITKNPDGAELKDVLPPEVYARWQPLKQKYFADDDGIERERPAFVAGRLYSRAMKQAGLASDHEVQKTIGKIADKHKLKFTSASYQVTIKEPVKAVREFKKSAMDDASCLARTIDSLDTDVAVMRELANAWAVGELEQIRTLNFADRVAACTQAIGTSSFAHNQPEMKDMRERAAAKWVAAAEQALASNASTFTVVPIKDILDPKGVIATLQAKGYTVEPPK